MTHGEQEITAVRFTTDGGWALSASRDGTLAIWNLATGERAATLAGHEDGVLSLDISRDSRHVLSGSFDGTLRLWFLDWDLTDREPADWDEAARPYVEVFLRLHTPPPSGLFRQRRAPSWTEQDFDQLLFTLGCAGYGWLRLDGVRRRLTELATEQGWQPER
jgi:hypothetical protein